jgi:hypothetical protein
MATIMDCPSCSRKLRVPDGPSDFQFQCPTCGHTFIPPGPEPTTVTRCRFCGEDILPDAAVCRHCGENLHDPRPPWERPGGMRFDWEPHRGDRILGLGVAGLVGCVVPHFLWIGVPLALAALFLGMHDVRRMDDCEMDPRGRSSTVIGIRCAAIGLVVSCLWLLCFGSFFWAIFTL